MLEINEPPQTVVFMTAAEAADMFRVSQRTWRTWDAGGHVPRPITISRSKFWRPKELVEWAKNGCPQRNIWDAMIEGKSF